MQATDRSTKAPLIVRRQRVLHPVMVHCLFSVVIYLLVSPSISSLFLCLSGVCLLIGVVIITNRIVPQALLYAQMSHTEPLFSSLADWRHKKNTHWGVILYIWLCWINSPSVGVYYTYAYLSLRHSVSKHIDKEVKYFKYNLRRQLFNSNWFMCVLSQ